MCSTIMMCSEVKPLTPFRHEHMTYNQPGQLALRRQQHHKSIWLILLHCVRMTDCP